MTACPAPATVTQSLCHHGLHIVPAWSPTTSLVHFCSVTSGLWTPDTIYTLDTTLVHFYRLVDQCWYNFFIVKRNHFSCNPYFLAPPPWRTPAASTVYCITSSHRSLPATNWQMGNFGSFVSLEGELKLCCIWGKLLVVRDYKTLRAICSVLKYCMMAWLVIQARQPLVTCPSLASTTTSR